MTYEILSEHSYDTTEDALYCLELGLSVFPINGYGIIFEQDNTASDIALGAPPKVYEWCCSCGDLYCESPGKHPLGPAWQRQATRDPDVVRRMDWRNHNIGVLTEGITVVDIDPRHGGTREWVDKHGEASTLVVRTNQGWHYYYKGETKTRIGLAPGIDIKSGVGGYVVGPGSHGEYREYVFESSKASGGFTEVPDWLHAELMRKKTDAKGDLAHQAVLNKGERDNGLIAVAGFLRRYGFSERELIDVMQTINRERCNPPLPKDDVERIARSAARYEIESNIPTYEGEILGNLKSIEWVVNHLEPPKFVIDQLWPEGGVNVMYGRPGTMKSYLALEWALHRSIGKAWHGFEIAEPVRVIYVAAEGLFGIGQRVNGIIKAHDLILSDLSGQFALYPDALNILDEVLSERLFVELRDYGAELVIFDTLRKSMTGGDENNTQDVGKMMTRLEKWSTKGNISTLLIHHANKAGTGHRGSSAIEGDAYNMWQILRTGKQLVTRIKPEKFKDAPDDWKLSIEWETSNTGLVSKSASLGVEEDPLDDEPSDVEVAKAIQERRQVALIMELHAKGLSVRDIAEAEGVTKSKSSVGRIIQENREIG